MARKPKPWYRKDMAIWCVTINGTRHNLGPDKDEAETKFYQLMLKPEDAKRFTVIDLMEEFLDWTKAHRRPDTYEFYRKRLKRYVDENPNRQCSELKVFHIQKWLDKQTWGATYKAGVVTTFRRCFNWAVRQGYLSFNPVVHLEKPKADRRESPVTRKEYTTLLEIINDDDPFRDLVVFSWETGCRPQESLRLAAENLKGSKIVMKNQKAKGDQLRVIHLTEKALSTVSLNASRNPVGPLFRNSRGAPWTTSACSSRFDRLHKKIGRRISLYDFRHGFATDLLKSGVDPVTVAELMGHKDLKMLMEIYQHVSDDSQFISSQLKKREVDGSK